MNSFLCQCYVLLSCTYLYVLVLPQPDAMLFVCYYVDQRAGSAGAARREDADGGEPAADDRRLGGDRGAG